MHTYQHFATVLAQLLGNETAVRLTVNGYMPLSVEDIGQSADGHRLIALCHYGEQQGDLMRDPEMVFEIHTSGLIFQDGEMPIATYHFKHALVQDAAYSTLPKKPRRVLHARIAKALESRFPERVTMEPELLAYHYEQAGLTGSAVDYWHRAARRDAERSANIEAPNHFNRALDVLKDLPQGSERNAMELELLIARGAPMLSVKGCASDEMEQNYLRAKDLLQENSGSMHQFQAIWGLWVFHLVRGQLANARGLAEDLLSLANGEQSSDLLIKAHKNLGSTYFFS